MSSENDWHLERLRPGEKGADCLHPREEYGRWGPPLPVAIPSYILLALLEDCSDEERLVYLNLLKAHHWARSSALFTDTLDVRAIAELTGISERRLLVILGIMTAKHLLTRVNRASGGHWRLRREDEGTQQVVTEEDQQ